MSSSREDRIAALPEHVRKMLDKRLAGRSAKTTVDRIPTVPREDTLPLSFAQQRLWFLHQYDPEGIEYNASVGLRLAGMLDLDALRTAVDGLVARHEALRTTFDTVDGVGVQRIGPPTRVPMPLTDLSSVPDQSAELDRLARIEVAEPFDLRTGPLARFQVWRLSDVEHVLVLSVHHIVTDGWSMGVLLRDLTFLYDAAVGGASPELPPLPVQPADFAVWQRNRFTESALAGDLAYWREQLAGITPLELPTDRPRPTIRTTNGTLHVSRIPADVTAGLSQLCRARGTTLFMLVVAATSALLSRWTGTTDIAIGAVSTGRGRAELENVVGDFTNTLVVRSTAEDAFDDYLAEVKQTVLNAFAHQDVPFEQLVEQLAPERDPSRTPLVQALLVLQNTGMELPRLHGLEVSEFPLPCLAAAFDITFDFAERDGEIELTIEYNSDLFDPGTIERIAGGLSLLLTGIVAAPEAAVESLPVVTAADRSLLAGWNDTAVARPADGPIHALFEAQVDRRPDEIAVRCGDAALSYRDLDERANRLAHRLIERGIGPDVLVGVLAERGVDAVVAILAVLKAGGAYVPLDPGYPAERLSYILSDSAVPIVLAQRQLTERFPFDDAEFVLLDEDWESRPAHRPTNTVGPGDLAYAIYTSGSTGTPKGVLIEHRNLGYIAHAWDALYGLTEARPRFMSVSSLSVDLFFADMLRSMFFGGTFLICPQDVVTEPPALLDLIERTGATGLELVPSLLRTLVQEVRARGTAFPPLAILSVGSEGWRAADCQELLEVLDTRTRVVNAYGGTEATVDSTVFVPSPENLAGFSVVPVGRPLANTRVYVVDENLLPVPVGVPGELCIAGDGIARGYLNRPELTAERFLPAPFDPGERLYRTGDRARWLAGGELEFLGRVDEQVKIRGFRVEPGEIESVLLTHELVRECVVVADESTGRRRLVAYVVAEDPDIAEVRGFLGGRLPDYMVPAVFVVLDRLPLTPGGKVDRRALPAPEAGEATGSYVAPSSPVEEELASIWASVLGVPRVGVMDNFFELGGDSILSIQVVSLARRAGLVLSSKDLFVRQTIRSLATFVRSGAPEAVPVDEGAVLGPVVLTPVQRWFFETNTVAPWHYNMSILLDVAEGADETALRQAVDAVVAHHDALEMRYERTGDGWRQWCSGERSATFEVVDADRQDLAATAIRAQSTLDLTKGPLVRAVLFRFGTGREQLFLTVYHLVVDGVSWRILLSDLDTAYQQIVACGQADPQVKTTSFQRWADRLAEHVRTGGFDDELPYWRRLDDFDPRLPVDADGPNRAAGVRTVSARLGAETTDTLLHAAPSAYHTQVNDLLISALATVLARWTGRNRLLIGMEGHGREDLFPDVDLSRTVGWFTTHFPVPLSVPPDDDPSELIKSIKEQLRAVPRRGIGYDALRYLTEQGHVLATQEQPQISFNYLGQWDTGIAGDLFRGRHVGIGDDHSKVDHRQYLLDVACSVEQGALEFVWLFSSEIHHESTIRGLADELVTTLQELVEHCVSPQAGGRTPSDFPLARLDQAAVDRIGDNVDDVYPLTPTQAGMLFHSLMNSDSGVYVDQMSFVLDEADDPAAVAAAWQAVVDGTPVLRSAMLWEGVPEPLQVVHRDVRVPAVYFDWTGLSADEQEAEAQRYLSEDRARGLDLSQAPLLRLAIARISPTSVRVFRTSHHLLLDGWSTFHVLSDLVGQHSFLRGKRATAPSARPPFRDYVAWLAERDRTATERHWRNILSGLDTKTPLPWDRPPAKSHAAAATASVRVTLPGGELARLTDFAKAHRLTVNTIVQGAWALLLSRYSGEQEVCFGATVSGRPGELPGSDDIVGMFINTLPVRVGVDGNRDLVGWLRDLQADQVASREHEFVSLADLTTWSDLPNGSALFDSIVVFENFPADTAAAADGGLRLDEVQGVESTSYPLNLLAYPGEDLAMMITYDPSLFEASTVDRLAEHLALVLGAMPRTAGRGVRDLPTATRRELDQFAVWNATGHPVEAATLVDLFERQVDRTPEAAAVIFEDTVLTYRELDTRANRMARALAERGVGPERIAAVLLPRGIDLVVALYAIHKAGGAYLPVDQDHPQDRVSFMLADAEPAVVITDRPLACEQPVVHAQDFAEYSGERPHTPLDPAAPAYVIYTSGSTGRPKGVVVPHSGIVNRLVWMQAEFGIDADDRVLQKTPAGFDVSVWEFFWPLQVGAALVVARPDGHRDPGYLASLIQREQVTTVHFVPSMLRAFVAEPASGHCTSLRRVICSGEALPAELWRSFREVLDAPLYNLYGPTEASVDVTYHRCAADDVNGTVPIGRPVWNTQVHVLDAQRRPLPLGAKGELYLGGAQIARGYLNRSELTRERFIGSESSRLYRTGDVARWRTDGVLEYLGRVDDQVKIRGFRIELGEIESVLTEHPSVSSAAVVLSADRTRLVGYLAPEYVDVGTVRAHLADRLPEYMVPPLFVTLAELPLTSSGKINRRALPEPVVSPRSEVAPRDAVEERLVRVWADTLGIEAVGIHDNFFTLGGDSIRSISVAARTGKEFDVRVFPRDVFDAPTVAAMAQVIAGRAGTPMDTIPVGPRNGLLPLSFAQQRLWFLYNLEPESPEYNVSAGLRLTGRLDVPALRAAVTTLATRHDILRTIYVSSDGVGGQMVRSSERPEFTVLSVSTEDELRRRVAEAASRPFDLATQAVMRALLLRVAEDDHVLVLSMHHIATDGWSMGVLTRELASLYRGESLPEPVLQYSDFAVWQRSALGEQVLRRDLAFWREELADLTPTDLPTDRMRRPMKTHSGALCSAHVPQDVVTLLDSLCASNGLTLFVALAAATQVLLSRWSGSPDVTVGTVTSGRDRAELTEVVGFFVNTVVLRSRVDGSDSFVDLMAQVRDTVSRAFDHQNVSFERLVDEVDVARDPSRTPLIQAMLVLQNAPIEPPDLPGVRVTEFPPPSVAAQFDLNIDCAERDGGLDVLIEYNPDLFDGETVEHLLEQLTTLLGQIVNDADRPIAHLSMLDDARKRQIGEWGDAERVPAAGRVHDLVHEQALRQPDGVAIVQADSVVTYAELDGRADRLAQGLAVSGLRPGAIVEVRLARGVEQIVAMLAVLKAGGAYRVVETDVARADSGGVQPAGEVAPEGTACVLDGSVPVSHDALAGSLAGASARFGCTAQDAWSYWHSPSTDTSLWELWAPLVSGGRVVIGEIPDEVTILGLTPTELRALARAGFQPPSDLRLMLVYGTAQAVPWDVPTVSIWSSPHTAGGALYREAAAGDRILLGTPLPNRTVRVLDEWQNRAPVGVPGDLHVDGVRVGVRARYLPDGMIEDLGSVTRVRGFQVDPRAVEAVLCRHANVDEAAVIAWDDHLVAFVVPATGSAPDDLTEYLVGRVPAYLIPAEFRVVDVLPQATDGRVDIAALREVPAELGVDDEHVAPRTEVERKLAEIWSAVLGVERVGVHDNFFDIGGESVKIMQVVSRVRAEGWRITARDLMLRQTIAALAPVVETESAPTSPAETEHVTGAVELTPIQHWFFDTHPVDPGHFTMSVLLELVPDVDETALRAALVALLHQHDTLRATFRQAGGEWHQHIQPPEPEVAVPRVEADGTDEIDRIAGRTQESIQLGGPLFQPVLLVRQGEPSHLLLTAHHLVVDAVSWQVLLDDLDQGYSQARAGKPVDLGPKSTSFQQWAARLLEQAKAGGWNHEQQYWSGIADAPLPADLTGQNTGASAASVTAGLDEQATDALLRRIPGRHRARIDDVLVAALGLVLSEWSGRERVVLGMEGHGREDIFEDVDLSRTVGWFTTIYPVELTMPKDADVTALIRATKRQLRAVPQRGLGYGVLRYLTGTVAGRTPQLLFNYLGEEWIDDAGSGPARKRIFGIGRDDSPDENRPFVLDVVSSVENGRLRFLWTYSTSVHRETTVRWLADSLIGVLHRIADDRGDAGLLLRNGNVYGDDDHR
ncbi:non-ribosomal peptide synthase domain TIGR01720/amino acid adenylation domain-containing protein [Amycolatopsis marina]|uniref:Non-ribosomal peptide synthase domain TIGR01720/amino acid adenylation domain-containing protein n=1 Tax=Amycolatopsis marina TaxID=490629 RepID=A0A1I0XUC5_9PSEU|nr:non-ribosomal peptide synthetase [Amycolatopsis marina]SFB04739.1 non-ribosomal peptide synthase domain TIGR01720/amino acid adenylation domain-containing protein [Amycolatopsis marina]